MMDGAAGDNSYSRCQVTDSSVKGISIAHGDYALEILPGLGGALAGLRFRGSEVLRRTPPGATEPLESAGFPLMPFANRIAHGRFRFGARQVQLARNAPGQAHPLHGQSWRAPWTVESHNTRQAVLAFEYAPGDWPWPYRAQQIFTLQTWGLEVRLTLENRASEPMPAGIGWHPYFRRTPLTRLRAEVAGVWLADQQCLPTSLAPAHQILDWSRGERPPEKLIDHCYTGWSGRADLVIPEEQLCVRLEADEPLRWLHVYVPPGQSFLCLEPVSHMPDALNRTAAPGVSGLRELLPGETLTGTIRLAVSPQSCAA
jgi:aldose 1-epimerase